MWAVTAKSVHYMRPFVDKRLTREEVVPSFDYDEEFKAITVGSDNIIWTSKSENQTNKLEKLRVESK